MFRTAAKRLIVGVTSGRNGIPRLRLPSPSTFLDHCPFSTATDSQELPNSQIPNQHHIRQETLSSSDSASSSSSSSSTWSSSTSGEESRSHENRRPRVEYQEEQARVLQAALSHVVKLGWTEAAMIAGARDIGMSPSIVGSFSRKEAELVEFFMDDCLQRLIDLIETDESLKNLVLRERVYKLVRARLEMQAPFISKWPQALSIQAQPANLATSFKQRATLVDEIWHAAGGDTSDIDWYVKRTILGGIYSTTEIYMLTDSSPDFLDTWAFLDNRLKDAFDIKKTVQEVKYLAEAVGAGMGNSFQGFVGKLFQR
ncbi:Ubiquinone biosynthesis protein COQ9-A, mitochondrial [Cucurbita argyrosperma subsp. argyrosperma]|uniref:Ubiquinone biosynthesis protein n=1 Tax=Cucurbita moschata TaxID=3662 RepID=A0A6J1HC59_CUCMO|nr:ubiquinone biosynthesis protein COQ9, mitochondrial [Cucurbita moschata]KAG7023712.1 Ubiquinone biosynthesis protein COQ9-A, mitochondrial [Cucurbita argyrosperma subsp. argyrosperma]